MEFKGPGDLQWERIKELAITNEILYRKTELLVSDNKTRQLFEFITFQALAKKST